MKALPRPGSPQQAIVKRPRAPLAEHSAEPKDPKLSSPPLIGQSAFLFHRNDAGDHHFAGMVELNFSPRSTHVARALSEVRPVRAT